jgi:hypothetical protein
LDTGGDETALLGGTFEFDGANAELLLAALPAFIHIPASDHSAAVLRVTLQMLEAAQMGASLMVRHGGRLARP